MTPQPAEQNDFRAYLRAIWRWKWLMLAFLIVVPTIAYVLEARKTRMYESSTLVQPQAVQLDPSLFGGQAVASGSGILSIARLVNTSGVAAAAAKLMPNPPANSASLLGEVSAQPDTDTGFLTISATDADPKRAGEIANAFGQAISNNQAGQARAKIDAATSRLQKQIAGLSNSPSDQTTKQELEGQVQRLKTLRSSTNDTSGAIIEKAGPGSPVGRNTRRAVELGIVIALLLGFGAVAIAENADRRIRSPDDLESLTGLPLLSVIPSTAFDPTEDDDLRDEEAFQMLRGALMYFNVDQRLRSIVVTSPGQEDGKTTVAVRLAQSAARAGRNVILVDADVRRPQIASRLHINTAVGLGPILTGDADLHGSMVEVPVAAEGDSSITAKGSLRVLPAGPPAPNPSELLSSERMEQVLGQLEQECDLVIVDSAAALAVSDALPLLRWTTGVVMVARLNRTTRAGIRRLQQIITSANGTLFGIVATGAPTRFGYDGYGYGYKDSRARKRAIRKSKSSTEQVQSPGTAGGGPSPTPEQAFEEREAQRTHRG
jgi:capsular exopolysaccharide synthesis family protein